MYRLILGNVSSSNCPTTDPYRTAHEAFFFVLAAGMETPGRYTISVAKKAQLPELPIDVKWPVIAGNKPEV